MNLRLRASVVRRSSISSADCDAMFGVFERYYQGATRQQFEADLDEKDWIILLRAGNSIRGFSTLLTRRLQMDGKNVVCVFSGDTVLEKEHWGDPALGKAFLRHLLRVCLENPRHQVYWMLISKGYKTYLLMARNFSDCWPYPGRATPSFEQNVMNIFYQAKFGERYDSKCGRILCGDGEDACRVGQDIAPISQEMRRRNFLIDAFAAFNPRWERGEELACIARMTLSMPLRYGLKKTLQSRSKLTARLVPALRNLAVVSKARLPWGTHYDR